MSYHWFGRFGVEVARHRLMDFCVSPVRGFAEFLALMGCQSSCDDTERRSCDDTERRLLNCYPFSIIDC